MAYAFLTLCMAGQGRGQEQAAALAGRSAGGFGGRDGNGKNGLVSDTTSFLHRGSGRQRWGLGLGGKGGQRQISVRH